MSVHKKGLMITSALYITDFLKHLPSYGQDLIKKNIYIFMQFERRALLYRKIYVCMCASMFVTYIIASQTLLEV